MRSIQVRVCLLLLLLASSVLVHLTQTALAQTSSAPFVPVEVESENGYARLIFQWQNLHGVPRPPEHTANIENGVLVLKFEQGYRLDLNGLRKQTEDYIALIRQDGDGRTLRMALKYPFRANSGSDEMDVAIDLVPESFEGTPPPYVSPRPVIDLALLVVSAEKRDVPTATELRRLQVAAKPLPEDAPRLPVRVIRSDTRSRIIFQWPQRVGYDVVREGNTVIVNFNQVARPKLTRLRIDPPTFVKTADAVKRLGGPRSPS